MKYIFEINVCTDGDFCLPFIPRGMKYDENGDYAFKKAYNNREQAIEDIIDICGFLKGYMYTSRDYVKELWNDCINNFIKRIEASDGSVDERIEEYIGGNYEGTEFIFYAEPQRLRCDFAVTDEEHKMIKNNDNEVTSDMIKDVVLALFRK